MLAMTIAMISTRLVSRTVSLLLRVFKHARTLGALDLGLILTNNTEELLNLPGHLPFFPTKTTDAELVKALIDKLHPVTCRNGLIRLGPEADGGYLVPNDLEGIEACFSPGVSDIVGFETECAERGMKVFMADGSVERPPAAHPQFRFIQKFIGPTTHGTFLSLEEWVSNTIDGSQADFLLQMDIEGYEYATFLATPSSLLERFRIIVVEFHSLEYLFCEPVFSIYSQVFEKLLSTHRCVHIHPNNFCSPITVRNLELPQLAEFTFLRNDRISSAVFARLFPHPLDRDNTQKPTYRLPKSFYRAQ
jgi:Methyltransferase FkbM domain